jgi:hypothetical protein
VTRRTDATTGLALTVRRHAGAVVIEAETGELTGPQLNAVVAALVAELRAATGRSPLAALRLAPDQPPAEAGAVTLDQVGGLDAVVAWALCPLSILLGFDSTIFFLGASGVWLVR